MNEGNFLIIFETRCFLYIYNSAHMIGQPTNKCTTVVTLMHLGDHKREFGCLIKGGIATLNELCNNHK